MFSELGGILHFSFRSGRGRKLSGDQITLPTTVDYSSVPKQVIASVVGDLIRNQSNYTSPTTGLVYILGRYNIIIYAVCTKYIS